MNIARPVIQALGADHTQWRGLVGPLMKVGFRSAQTTGQLARQGSSPRLVSWVMTLSLGFFGLMLALWAGFLPNPFLLNLMAITSAALVVFFLLLSNFQELAVSPLDYQVLGHRPVSARTYLLVRLTVTMAHQMIVAGLISGPSLLVCLFRFGWLSAIGLALAVALIVLGVVLALIGLYASLIHRFQARRLNRALSYAQLLLGTIYVIPMLFQKSMRTMLEGMSEFALGGWALAVPTVWFASVASLVDGAAGTGQWLGATLAIASVAVLGWFARDKLTLESAQKLGQELQAQAKDDSEQEESSVWTALPERLNVSATLIRGQFRHDTRFRMGVFGLLPLFVVYLALALRQPGSADPFIPGANILPLFLINLALLIAPVMQLEQLYASDSHRAGWIFFATPTDRARLAGDARHCVTLFFFVPYLILWTICLAWLFEAVWHALAHILLLGCLGVLAMQVFQFLDPRLPFALPVTRKRGGWPAFLRIVGLVVFATALAPYLQFAYPRPGWAIGTFAVAVLGVGLMERAMPGRLNRRLRWMESDA